MEFSNQNAIALHSDLNQADTFRSVKLLSTMKMIKMLLPFIFLLIFLAGCRKTGSGDDSNTVTLSSGIWKTSGVAGQVIDEGSKPVEGALVRFGNKSTTTDINGYFSFTQASFNTKEAFVVVNKPGYFNGCRTFIPRAGSNNYIKIQLLTAKIIGSVDASAGGTLSMSNGVSITLPANGIVNSNSIAVSGKVTVTAAFMDPTGSDAHLQMAGNGMGITAGNQQKLLKSFGMIAIELTSSSGGILNLKNGYAAMLHFPIPPGLLSSAPAVIPLSSFDETTGMWKEEGQAGKQGSTYIGKVSHFSFWNVDEAQDYVKLTLRLMSPLGNPVGGVIVKLTGSVTGTSGYGLTDNLGYVDGYVPAGESLLLEVLDNCRNELLKKDIGAFTTDTDLGDVVLANSVSLVTISGKVQNCNGLPLKSGTLQVVLDGTHLEFTNIRDGSFSITFPDCGGNNTITMIAIDESVMERSEAVPVMLNTGGITDVGVIQACGVQIPPYFTIYIDGVEQTWSNAVFGGWVDTSATYGDNSIPLDLFKGDTTYGIQNRTGLEFSIKAYNRLILPDSATLISISSYASALWYQAVDQRNYMVKINNFGDVGKILEGNFNGTFVKLRGCCPDSEVIDTVNINGEFRFRRQKQWWSN